MANKSTTTLIISYRNYKGKSQEEKEFITAVLLLPSGSDYVSESSYFLSVVKRNSNFFEDNKKKKNSVLVLIVMASYQISHISIKYEIDVTGYYLIVQFSQVYLQCSCGYIQILDVICHQFKLPK